MILSAKKKTSAVTGVDIDTDSVAAAEWPAGNGQLRASVQPLPAGAFDAGEVVDADAISAALGELFSRGKLAKQVRLAVASQGVAFRTLRLPLIENPEQLRSAVRFQAQEQIPMPLDSAVLDHQVIAAHVAEDGSRHVEVAVVAARRQSIDLLLTAARKAGLDPVGIDFAAFGMIRALAGGSGQPRHRRCRRGWAESEEYVPAALYCSLVAINQPGDRPRSLPASSPASPSSAFARSPRNSRPGPGCRSSTPSSGWSTPGWRPRWSRSVAMPPRPGRPVPPWRRTSAGWPTRCDSRSTTTVPRRVPPRSMESSSVAGGAPSPALPRPWGRPSVARCRRDARPLLPDSMTLKPHG